MGPPRLADDTVLTGAVPLLSNPLVSVPLAVAVAALLVGMVAVVCLRRRAGHGPKGESVTRRDVT